MTIQYGITASGFVTKPQSQILLDIETSQKAKIDPDLDVSADTEVGQINGIVSRTYALLWELAQVVYNSFDRDQAEGEELVALAKITGTAKRGPTYSTVSMTLNIDSGTTLVSGVNFVEVSGDPTIRFTPEADYTSPSSGSHAVKFRAENTGPVAAVAHSLTVISTPVVGWNTADNGFDVSIGDPVDTDDVVKENMIADVASTGGGTLAAIRDDVLALRDTTVPQIETVDGFENTGDVIDANGLPPHSFEILVYDGASADPGNAGFIGQQVWDSKDQGIRAFGAISVPVVDDEGNPQTVGFSRVAGRDVYLVFVLSTDASYPGNAAFQASIAASANSSKLFGKRGATVYASKLIAAAADFTGVVDVLSLTLGFAPAPVGITNLPIGTREISRFDTTRISV